MKNDIEPTDEMIKGAIKAIGEYLNKICGPAASEMGLLFQDKVKYWRFKNYVKIIKKSQILLENENIENLKIHPRLLNDILNNSSWVDETNLQNMWAGLLASSCKDKASDSNIIYIDILSKLSSEHAFILNYLCNKSEFEMSFAENMVIPKTLFIDASQLKEISKTDNFEDVAEFLTHLELLGLIKVEISPSGDHDYEYNTVEDNVSYELPNFKFLDILEVKVTNLGYRLFIKANGSNLRPSEYLSKNTTLPSIDDNEDDYDYFLDLKRFQ